MKISLIIGTLNRVEPLARLLDSLARQTRRPDEVFVVDQNQDLRLEPVIAGFKQQLPVQWIRTPSPGLSRARNVALGQISGDVVGFPDDDCWYPPQLLAQLDDRLAKNPSPVVVIDEINGRNRFGGTLNRYNVWLYGVSYRVFLSRQASESVGGFDETLGVGAGTPYGSGEDTDYLIRCLDNKLSIAYLSGLCVHHPPIDYADAAVLGKAYRYAVGRRRVMAKHRYPLPFRAFDMVSPLLRMTYSFTNPQKISYLWNQFLGRAGLEQTESA